MGRINVTIRIFVGTLVPNFCHHRARCHGLLLRGAGKAQRLLKGLFAPRSARAAVMVIPLGQMSWVLGAHLFVTVLAQDHCYSDLLRFVLDISDSVVCSAMTMKHCPSA